MFYLLAFAPNSHRKKLSTQTKLLSHQDQYKRHILRRRKLGVLRLIFALQLAVGSLSWKAVILPCEYATFDPKLVPHFSGFLNFFWFHSNHQSNIKLQDLLSNLPQTVFNKSFSISRYNHLTPSEPSRDLGANWWFATCKHPQNIFFVLIWHVMDLQPISDWSTPISDQSEC